MKILKNLFKKKEKKAYIPDPPGRTFKRILTGDYFSNNAPQSDEKSAQKSRESKIEQIKALALKPKFVRYRYKNSLNTEQEIAFIHVVFQQETLAEKWNMVHVTEISFIVYPYELDLFENMAGVSLENDFRDLTLDEDKPYQGEERREAPREKQI